jgi:hypothetical protein
MRSTLPNDRHLLDFSKAVLQSLPVGLRPNSLMVGAGDLEHDGIPNTQKFSQFDVFFCNAWDVNGSVQRNVDYINAYYPEQKVICVVDYNEKEQVERFISLFAGCFTLIDGHGGHTPHFTIDELRLLLAEGGEAVNIYEKSESLLSTDDARFWFNNGYFSYRFAKHTYLNSRIYNKNSPRYELPAEEQEEMRLKFLDKIKETYQVVKRTVISEELLENLDALPLSILQEILVSILFDNQIHLDMVADVRMNQRVWRDVSTVELVLKRVPVDYMEEKVRLCRDVMMKLRAEVITAKIREELEEGQVYPPYAKYKTLIKHILSDKFEAACLQD